MGEKARDYKHTTIRRLDTLSGNQCAFPNCNRSLIAKDDETIVSKICHIEAANELGPRFNSSMTDDERRHYNNLILMCDECHRIIDNKDNEKRYSVVLLKEWKKDHESKYLYNPNTNTSLLKIAINAIAEIDFEKDINQSRESIHAVDIDYKISYNDVKRNKSLIDQYKIYFARINTLYNELQNQGSFKRENLLRNINRIYLKVKGNYVGNAINPIELIRANADSIIEDVEQELLKIIEDKNSSYAENSSFELSIIMVDAFMRCKILEEPPKQ